MPTLKIDSLDINYEISGSGPLLILHHGWGSRASDWAEGGWLSALEPHAKILLFDAVGHGNSTLSHNPNDHAVEHRAKVVNALADAVGSATYGFLGFSMGGRTGLELAASSPERLSLLVIGGMHLLPPSVGAERIQRRIDVLRSGRGNFSGNDPLALAASNEALLRWTGAENRLDSYNAPTMFFCGEDDPHHANAMKTAENMRYEFVSLPNTNHRDTFYSSPEAVDSVAKFVSKNLK
jgi:pimeloyl-ACP methyl ester carboxylesterase